ncbi:PQQ-dependent sugar dehydrogenase [Sphingomonas sp. JC676]|uniref:PQQ-dependent sugar dehydrogenase n=1 Tax=Sphingomonas sp. JC676 TaxID=2768065 RepID=UPI001657FBFA|nr:PQQ-dependent sugar dehydrogenase [Sphingomonas sp. JC676]MBC9032748.1 PQQ-dependent sugar dehydrogenase [Sphingomonas sp. JC676]
MTKSIAYSRTPVSGARSVSILALARTIAPLLLVAGCSGGSGTGSPAPTPTPIPTPTPTPANAAPIFTSPATANVTENATAAYQATATDANGDPILFSISGGADAGQFKMTQAGALSFVTAPKVATPTDSNGDNVYAVQIGASDGKVNTTLDLLVTVTPATAGFRVVQVATGFTQPTWVGPIPGDPGHVFVTEKGGKIYTLEPATGTKTLLMTVASLSTDGERGVVGLAASPDYATSKNIFVHATAPDGTIEIRQYQVGNPTFNGTGYRVALSIPHPGANTHNGGWIGFGPDGYLYDAVGDGGTGGNPAQDTNSRLGKILRIKVDTTPGAATAFAPAPGNPFIGGGGDPYVFALGLRNPFRNSFAPDGRLVIADVGENTNEEVDLMPVSQPKMNFGWPLVEGDKVNTANPPADLVSPVTLYRHGTGNFAGNSITGGVVYRGPVAVLKNQYLFADFGSNNIWSVPYASLTQGTILPTTQYTWRNTDFTPDKGGIRSVVCFGEDTAGNVYIVDLGGAIYAILPK